MQIKELVPLSKFSPGHPFGTVHTLRRYVNEHRSGLAAAGALVEVRGRALIAPTLFERYVFKAGKAAAAQGGKK